jgi:hypothetical protein
MPGTTKSLFGNSRDVRKWKEERTSSWQGAGGDGTDEAVGVE